MCHGESWVREREVLPSGQHPMQPWSSFWEVGAHGQCAERALPWRSPFPHRIPHGRAASTAWTAVASVTSPDVHHPPETLFHEKS